MNTYYLTKPSKIYTLAWSLSMYVVFLGVFYYFFRNISCLVIYLLGLGVFFTYGTVVQVYSENLFVSEKGIEYRSRWMIVETKWGDIEGISLHWFHGFRNECLVVDNSKARIRKWKFPVRYPPSPGGFDPQKTIFPLTCFSNNWRDSELGQQIKQYAPHLFQ